MKYFSLLWSFLLVAACRPITTPPLAGAPPISATEEAKVSLTASPHLWDGGPRDFENFLVPIAVDIDNNSDKPIELHLPDFALVDSAGTAVPGVEFYGLNGQPLVQEHVALWQENSLEYYLGLLGPQPSAVSERDLAMLRRGFLFPLIMYAGTHVYSAPLMGLLLSHAMLDRVIAPHTRVHGFVYFSARPAMTGGDVALTWTPRDPLSHDVVAGLEVSFNRADVGAPPKI